MPMLKPHSAQPIKLTAGTGANTVKRYAPILTAAHTVSISRNLSRAPNMPYSSRATPIKTANAPMPKRSPIALSTPIAVSVKSDAHCEMACSAAPDASIKTPMIQNSLFLKSDFFSEVSSCAFGK